MAQDVFEPDSSADAAIVGPLHTITYATADEAGTRRFFVDGLGLDPGPLAPLDAAQGGYLGFAGVAVRAQSFAKPSAGRDSQVRVLYVDASVPLLRAGVDGRHVGGLSIGFPMTDLAARETVVNAAGFASAVGVKRIEFTSPDGVTYVSQEIHFIAPENVFVLGVKRPDGFRPVGPVDATAGLGAPAYSAQCLGDADAAIPFYRDVLGYEIRRDVDLTVAEPSGLRLDEGMRERFIQAFAPGASTGYLVFLDHYAANAPPPAGHVGPPARGVVMWSFPARDLDAVRRRAARHGVEIIHEPGAGHSPLLPAGRSLMLRGPGGFPVELFEARAEE